MSRRRKGSITDVVQGRPRCRSDLAYSFRAPGHFDGMTLYEADVAVRGVRTRGEVTSSARSEGPTVHPSQARPSTARTPHLNHKSHPLHAGIPVVLRYDPANPRRVVVVHTKDGGPGKVSYSATANLTWGVFFVLFGVGMGVGAFLQEL